MSIHQINPSDNSGATRNLNNYVAKQVVAQALRLNTTPSPMKTSRRKPLALTQPGKLNRCSCLDGSSCTRISNLKRHLCPRRQYAGEAQPMAAILDWQRNLRKELEADNLATEHPPCWQ